MLFFYKIKAYFMIIFGIKISSKKKVTHALNKIYGIGLQSSAKICKELGIAPKTLVGQLSEDKISDITQIIKTKFLVEDNLRKINKLNIRRLVQTRSYRGLRHIYSLPVRGQRTSTNAQTQKRLKRFY
jgi:small subunit ribosomal protein S13